MSGISITKEELVKTFLDIFDYLWEYEGLVPYDKFDERTERQLERDSELLKVYQENTTVRSIAVGSIEIDVYPRVFPPDKGRSIDPLIGTIRQQMKRIYKDVPEANRIGIDIGTGTGILALCLAEGCPTVYAVDIDQAAVLNAKANVRRFEDARSDRSIEVIQGDLFEPLPHFEADKVLLIVFNHPYYPSPVNIYNTLIPEGGQHIVNRFLTQAATRIGQKGRIIMPFSGLAGDANNPIYLAQDHNLRLESASRSPHSSKEPEAEDHIFVFALNGVA